MTKTPKTITPVIYAIAAAVLLSIANRPGVEVALYLVLNAAGAAFAVAGLVEFVYLVAWRRVEIAAEKKRIDCTTPESTILTLVRSLSVSQIQMLMNNMPAVLIAGGMPAPTQFLKTPGGEVPWVAIREFFRRSPARAIVPIRTYSDGSNDRLYTQWLTDLFVYHGFARVARGNQAAEWISRPRAAQFIGLDLGEIDNQPNEED